MSITTSSLPGSRGAWPKFDRIVDAYKTGFSPLEAAKLLRGGTAAFNSPPRRSFTA